MQGDLTGDKIKEFVNNRLQNNQMKFEDLENMSHANQKRIEELFLMIKNIEVSTVRLEQTHQSTMTKFVCNLICLDLSG